MRDLFCPMVLASFFLVGCGALPKRPVDTVATPIPAAEATALGRSVAPALAAHPGLSGVYPLKNGNDAFVARMALAATAERTLDVQYYIWHRDDAGKLLANQLLQDRKSVV